MRTDPAATSRRARVRLADTPRADHVAETGAASSTQRAEVELPADALEGLWRRENLERLARAYWHYLNRISLGLLRVVYSPTLRIVVLLARPLSLLRFYAPDYHVAPRRASVTWRIERGLLVARQGRDRGYLRITIERCPAPEGSGSARLILTADMQNFYPWLRGSGAFARFGASLYSRTQLRIHVFVMRGFLRSLARLDLPPAPVGALRGEIADGSRSGDPRRRG